jgi:hypothetical protein
MNLSDRNRAIETYWYDEEKRIMYQAMKGFWSLNDLQDAFGVAEAMVEEPRPIVDFIVDMRESRWIPPGVIGLTKRLGLSGGVSVVVTHQQFLKTLIGVMQRLLPNETIYYAETITEAEEIICREQQARNA